MGSKPFILNQPVTGQPGQGFRQLPGARIVLADCGMTEEARALASYLSARTEGVSLTEGTEIHVG